MNNLSILEHVKIAINPQFQDWVLFKNDTYIIFDDVSNVENVRDEAIKLMKEFGPVFAGGSAGDFNVIHLNFTESWLVSGHGYGMYTYVHPSELDHETPNDLEIGLYGRSKRNSDGENPEIVYINTSENSL
ncbi:hypothetical protein [Chryseobacterium sp. Marseille-Q3244]|uniref:hypothetical protein n=1 Tax=Chryseobacterium sp. Marseille-Q3244 TaxID=2758092 RepID=UPI002023D35D|nr:hypothetical protein [Chryseobacterium sp. Marseille-Q3244]